MTEPMSGLLFERKPSPVLAEHRPLYKIGQVLLILHLSSRAGRSRLLRLHLFNWALKSVDRQKLLIHASTAKELKVSAWGFDPALAIAVRFAIAEGLVREESPGYEITDEGVSFVKEILKDPELFSTDAVFLHQVGKGITEAMVDAVANGWEAQ